MLIVAISLTVVILALTAVLFYQRARQKAMRLVLANTSGRLGDIVESAMDVIITVDENERIIIFNAAAEAVFGCPREQALGAPLAWFIPQRFRAAHSDHIQRFAATGVTSRRMGMQRIITGLRRDSGEEFPIEASISQHSEDGRKFFTVILRDVTERVRADESLRRSKTELLEFATVAQSLREQEKKRIARELHDELAQALAALKMDMAWLRDNPDHEQGPSRMETMLSLLDDTAIMTRRIAADLRPLMLDDLGLVPAAEWLVQSFTQRTGVRCEFATSPGLELKEPYATAVFRILQESLTNVARHAQASQAEVAMHRHDGTVVLMVRDNGRGFAAGSPSKPNSFGLIGLRERVYLLNGKVAIDSAPGRGTLVEVRIPLEPPAAAP